MSNLNTTIKDQKPLV